MNHRPVAIGMVLCEQVIVEEGTRNVTPVNCFSSRELDDVPEQATFFVLTWLSGGMGEMEVELVVERLDNLEETYRLNRTFKFPDRLANMRFSVRIRDCSLPVEGHYQVLLTIGGELTASRKFRVNKKG